MRCHRPAATSRRALSMSWDDICHRATTCDCASDNDSTKAASRGQPTQLRAALRLWMAVSITTPKSERALVDAEVKPPRSGPELPFQAFGCFFQRAGVGAGRQVLPAAV